jgi:hypothetical protein
MLVQENGKRERQVTAETIFNKILNHYVLERRMKRPQRVVAKKGTQQD